MIGSKMNDVIIDRILENMVQIMPVLHRKLLRMDLGGVTNNLTRLHLTIMGVLSENSMTMSELAKRLMLTKPQMTHLVDYLVGLEIIERHPDTKDRRVINLVLTEQGFTRLEDMHRKVKESIRDRLACLTRDELIEMANSLEKLRNIGAKL